VTVTVQDPPLSVQGRGLTPAPAGLELNLTIPVGVDAVPGDVSVTVTMQVIGFEVLDALLQVIAVNVARVVTSTPAVPVLGKKPDSGT
jgi:hypothetical protein